LGDPNCADPKTTADKTIGDTKGTNITSANVTVSISCNATAFDANAMRTIAQNALKQKADKDPGAGYVLAGNIVPQIQSLQTQKDGSITFSVMAQGLWYYQWTDANKQTLLNKIKGQTKAQAQTILNSSTGIGNAKIDINNGGTTLPSDVNQIAVDVKVPNGLSGGNNQIPILTLTPIPTSAPILTPTPTDPGSNLGS
jgi:hypothetical protein